MENIMFMAFIPMLIWIGIVAGIVAAVKGNFRRKSSQRQPMARRRTAPRRMPQRPQMQKGLFDMKTDKNSPKPKISFSMGKSFRNTDYDEYTARGRRKDVVTGYDRKISGGTSYRRAAGMQFSHTYDGHEPWDKCLPKEKDPWDKDFYTG